MHLVEPPQKTVSGLYMTRILGSQFANDLPKIFSDGLFGLVIKKNGARGEEFAKLARSAKLAP